MKNKTVAKLDQSFEADFNAYTKELMIQLLASNDNKFFSREEDLKKHMMSLKTLLKQKRIYYKFATMSN